MECYYPHLLYSGKEGKKKNKNMNKKITLTKEAQGFFHFSAVSRIV